MIKNWLMAVKKTECFEGVTNFERTLVVIYAL